METANNFYYQLTLKIFFQVMLFGRTKSSPSGCKTVPYSTTALLSYVARCSLCFVFFSYL